MDDKKILPPKAAATPAADPHDIKSRFSLSLRKFSNFFGFVSHPKFVDFPCEIPAPAIAPL